MSICGGHGRGDRAESAKVEGRDLTPEERVKKFQEQMESYVDLVSKKAPTEEIKKAEEQLSEQLGKDRFEAFKRQLPKQLRVRKGLDAQRIYRQFRLPGRRRIVHDRRGMRERETHGRREHPEGKRGAHRAPRAAGHVHVREGRLVKQRVREYVNYFADRMQSQARQDAQRAQAAKQLDELLSKFEKLIISRFEGDKEVAKKTKHGKPTFFKKTESQWKQFFNRFKGRVLRKKVPTKNIQDFVFRGLVPRGVKGVVISDMTLASGRVERFVRFSIIAEAMAKLAKMMPGQKFGKDLLSGEELFYLALAAARGREYRTGPRPTQGMFMGGAAEEKAAKELGIPLSSHLDRKAKVLRERKGGGLFGGFGKGKGGEPEELPYQFIPWWHWGNLKRPGKFKMTTVAFYIALGVITILGIIAVTARLLK